jgi:hypothetical protein
MILNFFIFFGFILNQNLWRYHKYRYRYQNQKLNFPITNKYAAKLWNFIVYFTTFVFVFVTNSLFLSVCLSFVSFLFCGMESHTHSLAHQHTHTQINTNTQTQTCTYTYTFIHTHAYTHTLTHTHTHTYLSE